MGKNKERLNSHNLDLAAILADIQNLPPAGGEDLQETVTTQTDVVNTLLTMVKRKVADHKGEGEYVWKKSMIGGNEYTIDIKQTNDVEPIVFQLSTGGTNLSSFDTTLLTGKYTTSGAGYTLTFTSGTTATFNTGKTVKDCTYTYDSASGRITLTIPNISTVDKSTWSSVNVTVEEVVFVTHVVSSAHFLSSFLST